MTDQKAMASVAYLVHAECVRIGRAWDIQGVHAAVRGAMDEDGRRADQVIVAGFAAASDSKAATPASIRWAARYLQEPTGAPANSTPGCDICGRPEAVHDLAESRVPPESRHQFTRGSR